LLRGLALRYNWSMKVNVTHVAKLANLSLKKEEENKLEKQLEEILSYVEKLKEVDTSTVKETSQVTGLENVTREDMIENCELSQEEVLSNARSTHNGLFKIKGILSSD